MIDVILGQDVPLYKNHEVPLNVRSFWKNWVTLDVSFKVSEPNLVTRLNRTPYI
jgi:hypothetical protein